MTVLISIRLDRDLIEHAALAAKHAGMKRHEWIEAAIRSGLGGGVGWLPSGDRSEESPVGTQPSTPSQIHATPIEENSEKNTEKPRQDWCKWGKENLHKWAWASDIERCDLCYLRRERPEPTSSVQRFVNDLADRMDL